MMMVIICFDEKDAFGTKRCCNFDILKIIFKKNCKYKNALWQLKKLKVTNDGIRVFWLFLESRIQIRSKFCMFFSIHLHYHDRLKIWKISVFFGMLVMLILVLWGLGWFFLLFFIEKMQIFCKKTRPNRFIGGKIRKFGILGSTLAWKKLEVEQANFHNKILKF